MPYPWQRLKRRKRRVHYVAVDSANPVAPYTTWAMAATNIQDAVDAATVPGALVLVTNGIYATSGRAGIRVAVDKPLRLRSVNGPQFTAIRGDIIVQPPDDLRYNGSPQFTAIHGTAVLSGIRCVYLTNSATLSGFTLTNGTGGVFCESLTAVVSNCVVAGNLAYLGGGAYGGTPSHCTLSGNHARFGGGASDCTLNNCTLAGNSTSPFNLGYSAGGGAYRCLLNNCALTGNSAHGMDPETEVGGRGGGADSSLLNNCTLSGNFASSGGGAAGCILNNCIVYFNQGANYASSILNYSCTPPLPSNGIGNITNAPLFVDKASGNLRLQSNSPCINAGRNAFAPAGPDLDGNQRIKGGSVDIGAYEFQLPTSIISYAWLQQYALPTDGLADTADPDGDGLNNWQEWRCGTDPTNALSLLRLLAPAPVGPDLAVRWESVSDRSYFLEWSTNLAPSSQFLLLATNLTGQAGTTTYTHANAAGAGPIFYRVGEFAKRSSTTVCRKLNGTRQTRLILTPTLNRSPSRPRTGCRSQPSPMPPVRPAISNSASPRFPATTTRFNPQAV